MTDPATARHRIESLLRSWGLLQELHGYLERFAGIDLVQEAVERAVQSGMLERAAGPKKAEQATMVALFATLRIHQVAITMKEMYAATGIQPSVFNAALSVLLQRTRTTIPSHPVLPFAVRFTFQMKVDHVCCNQIEHEGPLLVHLMQEKGVLHRVSSPVALAVTLVALFLFQVRPMDRPQPLQDCLTFASILKYAQSSLRLPAITIGTHSKMMLRCMASVAKETGIPMQTSIADEASVPPLLYQILLALKVQEQS